MKDYKVIESCFDNGFSYVRILTKDYGRFTGKAVLHFEDAEAESRFLGCEIAECRAVLKYVDRIIEKLNAEIEVLKYVDNKSSDKNKCLTKVLENKQSHKAEILKEKEMIKAHIKYLSNEKVEKIKEMRIKYKKEEQE